jgi:multicomponent Na+:H+ antiporter subunit F
MMTSLALGLLLAALLLSFVRLIRGPTLPDRVVALDTIAGVAVAIMATLAIVLDEPVFLDVGIVVALVAFVGTVAFAQYLGREASR